MKQGMITGIDHISMDVPDVDASARFYCEGLGLTLKRRDDYNAIVITPDGVILEINPGGNAQGDADGLTHVCYNTYDVDAAFERALSFGAVPSRESDPKPYTYKNLRMAFVRAPGGEEIEFWGIQKADGSFGEKVVDDHYIKQFVHAAFTVEDMDAQIRFFEGLGAKLKINWEWGCSMTLPDGREFELFTGGHPVTRQNAYTHIGLLTDHVEEALNQCAALGGKIAHEAYDWSNLRVGFATDIHGETLEFFSLYTDGREPDVFEKAPDVLPDLFAGAPEYD